MKDRTRDSKNRGLVFTFDRLIFARNDYVFRSFIDAYECKVASEVCIGYGGKELPAFPVVIVSSQSAAKNFVKRIEPALHQFLELENDIPRSSDIERRLSAVFGVTLRVVC